MYLDTTYSRDTAVERRGRNGERVVRGELRKDRPVHEFLSFNSVGGYAVETGRASRDTLSYACVFTGDDQAG